MKLEELTIDRITDLLCHTEPVRGHISEVPIWDISDLIDLFLPYGFFDWPEPGVNKITRREYVNNGLNELNGTKSLKKLIEYIADPRVYINKDISIEDVIEYLNELLKYDGYQLQKRNLQYKVINVEFIEKKDTNDALFAIADEMRERKKEGEFDTFMDAYRWAEKNLTQNGNPIKALSLQGAYQKAKSAGKVD